MSAANRNLTLDRYTRIGDLANSVHRALKRTMLPFLILLTVITGALYLRHSPGATAFAEMAVGTLVILLAWRSRGIGLPVIPLLALQNLIVYGLPIVSGHEVITAYPESFVTKAGLEVLIFSIAMAASWRLGMELMHPATPVSFALRSVRQEGTERLQRLGLTLITASSIYLLAQSLGWLDPIINALPAGSFSLIAPLVAAAASCGFFLVAMFIGAGKVSTLRRALFWGLLVGCSVVSASGLLLSATTAIVAAVLIGLFWGSGRMPWLYLTVVIVLLGFLNLGKITMRERYWGVTGETENSVALTQLPRFYAEWADASVETLMPPESDGRTSVSRESAAKGQSLLERVNNLQNLLFVIDAVEMGHIAPLHGATYGIIPPLLLPRIFWPDKPRTHEGQIMLNVHFGRQDLDSTFQTYIAWGLLPEAYGNFGSVIGSVVLGVVLGLLFAALENFTAPKVLISLEGFISFMVLLGMMGSVEMVASVLVTSIFQSAVVLVVATLPFVERTVLKRPGT